MKGIIYINGLIGHDEFEKGVELIDIVSQVKQQPEATSFDVIINSEGGMVDVGFDIYNYIKSINDSGKPVTMIGTEMVASAATVIFMAGSVRILKPNTMFMIHLPWGSTIGTSQEIQDYADMLAECEKKIVDFYKKALNIEESAIFPLLKNETWLTEQQASGLGFVTKTYEPVMAKAKAYFNLKTDKMEGNLKPEDKKFFEDLFAPLAKLFKVKEPQAKMVKDANDVEIDFPDLADTDTIEVGAMATVDGKPAQGEYVMPSGETYVFDAGALTEIKPAGAPDQNAQRIAELEQQLEDAKAAQSTAEQEATEAQNKLKKVETEFTKVKAQINSKFDFDQKKDPKDPPTDPQNRAAGYKKK